MWATVWINVGNFHCAPSNPVFHLWLWANGNKVIMLKSFGVTSGVFVIFWPGIKKMSVCAEPRQWFEGGDELQHPVCLACRFFFSPALPVRWWHIPFTQPLDEWQDKTLTQMLSLLHHVSLLPPSPALVPPPPPPLRIMVLKMRAHHMCWRDGRGTGLSRARLKAQLLYKLLCVRSLDDTPSCG